MIAKMIKGCGFRGAIEYDLQQDKGYLLETNMAGTDARTLAREFGQVRALRPKLNKAVCHISIGLPPGETLTDNQWKEVANDYLEKMGFHESQYVISRHTDTKHQHIHILANRITMTGDVVSDSMDYQRQEAVMRGQEKKYGLRSVTPSREVMRRALGKDEIERALRTGKAPVKQRLQQLVDAALRDRPTLDVFTTRLKSAKVEIVLNQASTGTISGVSFQLDNIRMKGSDLGKGYTWKQLKKRGVQHEQVRGRDADGKGRKQNGNRQHFGVSRDFPGREVGSSGILGHSGRDTSQRNKGHER